MPNIFVNKITRAITINTLAITKAIVEKHHGTISAENTEKGLNIIMCFPHLDGYVTY